MKKIFVSLIALGSLASCSKEVGGHACPWPHCPYKGITIAQYPSVAECQPGSDCYILDSLHFVYPNKEYDYLDSLVFSAGEQ